MRNKFPRPCTQSSTPPAVDNLLWTYIADPNSSLRLSHTHFRFPQRPAFSFSHRLASVAPSCHYLSLSPANHPSHHPGNHTSHSQNTSSSTVTSRPPHTFLTCWTQGYIWTVFLLGGVEKLGSSAFVAPFSLFGRYDVAFGCSASHGKAHLTTTPTPGASPSALLERQARCARR